MRVNHHIRGRVCTRCSTWCEALTQLRTRRMRGEAFMRNALAGFGALVLMGSSGLSGPRYRSAHAIMQNASSERAGNRATQARRGNGVQERASGSVSSNGRSDVRVPSTSTSTQATRQRSGRLSLRVGVCAPSVATTVTGMSITQQQQYDQADERATASSTSSRLMERYMSKEGTFPATDYVIKVLPPSLAHTSHHRHGARLCCCCTPQSPLLAPALVSRTNSASWPTKTFHVSALFACAHWLLFRR